jgi:hypothetical protein
MIINFQFGLGSGIHGRVPFLCIGFGMQQAMPQPLVEVVVAKMCQRPSRKTTCWCARLFQLQAQFPPVVFHEEAIAERILPFPIVLALRGSVMTAEGPSNAPSRPSGEFVTTVLPSTSTR